MSLATLPARDESGPASTLPSREVMLQAFLTRASEYEGVFFTGVRTTGVFCRPTCPARKPDPRHVEFFPSTGEALRAGFRPCMRCHPLELEGRSPAWLEPVLAALRAEPGRRWLDGDLRELGVDPARVRRWFQQHHGMTFHAYSRALRLGAALGGIRRGSSVAAAAFDHGYESLSGFNEAFRQALGDSPSSLKGTVKVAILRLPTPLGPMILGATDDALCLLEFADRRMLNTQLDRVRSALGCTILPGRNPVLDRAIEELEAYFAGELRRFSTPLLTPGTAFQQEVWENLLAIPFGETRSYSDIAAAVGRPEAVRAVARANGDNRIAIMIPCHRVVGKDGQLTGYGGGLWRKRRLLELEQAAGSTGQARLDLD